MPAQPYQRLRVNGPWAMEDAGVTPAPQLSSMSLAPVPVLPACGNAKAREAWSFTRGWPRRQRSVYRFRDCHLELMFAIGRSWTLPRTACAMRIHCAC